MNKLDLRSEFDSLDGAKRSLGPVKRAPPASCYTGGFYKTPSANATVNIGQIVKLTWDTSCMDPAPKAVNILLNAPYLNPELPNVHTWANIPYDTGSFDAPVESAWFSKNSTVQLQFLIQESGDPDTPAFFLPNNNLPPGPFFNGVYDPKNVTDLHPVGTTSNNGTVSVVTLNKPAGMTKGQIAAAVIMPILFVAACIAAYVIYSRKKEAVKRKEYRENLDQRMSIAPGSNWAPISAAGASAAIRHSMAMNNMDRQTRASSFFSRPTSTFETAQEMRQTRRGGHGHEDSEGNFRQSRISFAESSTKPLRLDRPAVPPLPVAYRKSTFDTDDTRSPDQTALSPTQRQGAFVLDDDSIRDRLSGGSANARASVMDLGADSLPALAMMRTNDHDLSPNNEGGFILTPKASGPTPPAPVLTREESSGDYKTYSIGAYSGNTDSLVIETTSQQSYFGNSVSPVSDPDEALKIYAARNPQTPAAVTTSPFSGFAAGPTLAAAAGFDTSTPDALFRAYAATRPAVPPTVAAVPVSPMRTLYNPTMTQGLGLRPRADTLSSSGDKNPYRDSMAPSAFSDEVGKAR